MCPTGNTAAAYRSLSRSDSASLSACTLWRTSPEGVLLSECRSGAVFNFTSKSRALVDCRHLNPAVSFGMLVSGEMPLVRFVLYVVAQLAGSSLACGALRVALPAHYFAQVNVNGSSFNFGVTMPSSSAHYEICTSSEYNICTVQY